MSTFRRAALRTAPVFVAASAALAACSTDGGQLTAPATSPPAPAAVFTAVVSGAVQAKLAGDAVLFLMPETTIDSTVVPPSTLLGMADTLSQTVVAFQWVNTATPVAGTFAVGLDSGRVAMRYDQGTGARGTAFDGTSGTITIISVTPKGVVGSYSVNAVSAETRDTISVSGTFSAPVQPAP